jgi:hypothetical protein
MYARGHGESTLFARDPGSARYQNLDATGSILVPFPATEFRLGPLSAVPVGAVETARVPLDLQPDTKITDRKGY